MKTTEQVLIVAECELHVESVIYVFDSAQIGNWAVLDAGQARLCGALVYQPPNSYQSARVVMGSGTKKQVARALSLISQGISANELCAGCTVHVFEAQRVQFGEVFVDPVCGMVVEKSSGFEFDYKGKPYLFCSPDCRKAFEANPGAFVWRGGK